MNKLRVTLSALALVLAGAAAWATNANSETALVIQQVTNATANPCATVGKCDTSVTGQSCQSASNDRYVKVNMNSCANLVTTGQYTPN